MQQERETFFVFNPGRTFCTALVALFFGGLYLAVGIKHRDGTMITICSVVVAVSMFSIFHSVKWIYRMCREYLS